MTPTLSSVKRPSMGTVYLETLRRHWNIWVTYGVLMLILGPVMMTVKAVCDPLIVTESPQMLELPSEILLHLALLAVGCCLPLLLFSYLNNRRAVDLYHALPVTRGQLYWGKTLAGLTILLTPYLLLGGACGLFIIAVGGKTELLCRIGQIAAIALALYGAMVFVMANCGTLFESIVYFSIAEVFYLMFVGLMSALLSEMTFGWNETASSGLLGIFVSFAPLWQLYKLLFGRALALRETLQMLLCCGGMLAAGALLHKRRRSEAAGQSFAFRPLFYIEAVGASLTVGMGFYYLFQETAGLLLGGLTGCLCYFILDSIRSRGFKNIRETLGVCVGMAAAAGMFFGTAALSGTFGYERYLPPASGVKSVSISWRVNSEEYLSRAYTLTEKEDIDKTIAFHRIVTENKALIEEYSRLLTEVEDFTPKASVVETEPVSAPAGTVIESSTVLEDPALAEANAVKLARREAITALPLPEGVDPFPSAEGYSPYELGYCSVTLDYMMRDGRLVTRYYQEVPLALTMPLYEITAGSGCSQAMAARIEMDLEQSARADYALGKQPPEEDGREWTIALIKLTGNAEIQQNVGYEAFKEIMSAFAEDLKARPEGWDIHPKEAPLFELSVRAGLNYNYGYYHYELEGGAVYQIDRHVLAALAKYDLDYSGEPNNSLEFIDIELPSGKHHVQYLSADDYDACMTLPSAQGSLFQFGGWCPYIFWDEMEQAGFVKEYTVTTAQREQLARFAFNHYIAEAPVDVLYISGEIYLVPEENRAAVQALLAENSTQ